MFHSDLNSFEYQCQEPLLCAKARNVTKVFKDLHSYKSHYEESEKHPNEFQPPFKCDRQGFVDGFVDFHID